MKLTQSVALAAFIVVSAGLLIGRQGDPSTIETASASLVEQHEQTEKLTGLAATGAAAHAALPPPAAPQPPAAHASTTYVEADAADDGPDPAMGEDPNPPAIDQQADDNSPG